MNYIVFLYRTSFSVCEVILKLQSVIQDVFGEIYAGVGDVKNRGFARYKVKYHN
jgi:hypothetical protein